MRQLRAGLFLSLDGVYEAPGPADDADFAGWTMPYWDDAIGEAIGTNMAASDAILLGRVTYQGFKAAFADNPNPDPFTDYINGVSKYLVSTTVRDPDWANTTVISGKVMEEVAGLKAGEGKDIFVNGSGTLLQGLLEADLVDELSLLVYPVVLGRGKRLFREGLRTTLELKKATAFKSGVVHLVYTPAAKRSGEAPA
jgi:dihydrofolate reductase